MDLHQLQSQISTNCKFFCLFQPTMVTKSFDWIKKRMWSGRWVVWIRTMSPHSMTFIQRRMWLSISTPANRSTIALVLVKVKPIDRIFGIEHRYLKGFFFNCINFCLVLTIFLFLFRIDQFERLQQHWVQLVANEATQVLQVTCRVVWRGTLMDC